MKKVIFIYLLMLLSCSVKKYTLRDAVNGIVYNEKNAPIDDVEIKFIENKSSFMTKPVKSNNEGLFFIEGIKTDNYKQFGMLGPEISNKIVISKTGYKNDTIDIKKFDKNLSRNNYDTLDLGKIYMKKQDKFRQ